MDPPAWLDELTFGRDDGPPWLSMGLSRCDHARWLVPDEHRSRELAECRRLLGERHDEVFGALSGTEAAGAEVLALVRDWFGQQRPDLEVEDDPVDVHPLEAAGRLTQEDLCLMMEHDGAHHLDAACLCFPSHWRLADKLGRPTRAVHGPVPGYGDELAERVDTYLRRLRPGVIGVRRNWSVHDSPALFAPVPPADPEPVVADDVPTRLWLRSERQTLRRLTASRAVLFTIRVQQTSFASLALRPELADAFVARLDAQPAALTAMNGLTPHRDAVLAWLGSVSDR